MPEGYILRGCYARLDQSLSSVAVPVRVRTAVPSTTFRRGGRCRWRNLPILFREACAGGGHTGNRGVPGAPVFTRRAVGCFNAFSYSTSDPPGLPSPARRPAALSVCRAPAPHDALAPRPSHVGSIPHPTPVPPSAAVSRWGARFSAMFGASPTPPPFLLFSTASMAQASRERAYARWARSLST